MTTQPAAASDLVDRPVRDGPGQEARCYVGMPAPRTLRVNDSALTVFDFERLGERGQPLGGTGAAATANDAEDAMPGDDDRQARSPRPG